MPIETSVTVIADLNASYPATTDAKALGANHLQNIKTAVKSLNTASSTKGAAQVGFLQAGTGASTTRKSQDKLRETFITPEDFDAVGNGTADDATALANFFAQLNANPSVPGWMPAKTYASSGAHMINANVRLYCVGAGTSHDVGTSAGVGTIIKRITTVGGTVLTVSPTEGASAQRLDGVVIDGLSINGNSLAAKGFLIKSTRRGYFNIYAEECTTSGIETDTCTTLGESADTQENTFRIGGRQYLNSTPILRLKGTGSSNTSFNNFEQVHVVHKDGSAIIHENSDNNDFAVCRVFRAAGGTATNSVEWHGATTATTCCRAERYGLLSTTVAAIAKGTGSYTVGAYDIVIDRLDLENGTPSVTVETGAGAWDGSWVETTPTPSSAGGAFTTASAVLRVKRDYMNPKFNGTITITTVGGTASGLTLLDLPYKNRTGGQNAVFAVKRNSDGVIGVGVVSPNAKQLSLARYDGATLIAATSVSFSGSIETTASTVLE
jgi:hypothetical protein